MRFLRKLWSLSLLIVTLVMFAYFAHFNQDRSFIRFPPWIEHIALPTYALTLAAFMVGAIVASTYFGLENFAKALEIRRLKKRQNDPMGSLQPSAITHTTPSLD